jgi:hypothetical protein
MPRLSDIVPVPGELVVPRASSGVTMHGEPRHPRVLAHVEPGTLGFVVSTNVAAGWVYVLWSRYALVGWSADGELRRVNQRG